MRAATQPGGSTRTGAASTPTVTRVPELNACARALLICATTTVPSDSVALTVEIGPRKATDATVADPSAAAVTVTVSGRTMARPGPASMEPLSTGTSTPRTRAEPSATVAATLLCRPTNSATNGVAGLAYSSAGGAICSSLPWLITPTRSATARASS